jgi:hypothetical protein
MNSWNSTFPFNKMEGIILMYFSSHSLLLTVIFAVWVSNFVSRDTNFIPAIWHKTLSILNTELETAHAHGAKLRNKE